MITKVSFTALNIDMAYTKTTSKKSPHKYHVVYQVRATVEMNRYIAEQVNILMKFDILDI